MAFPSGSPKNKAATADASTTFPAISINPDQGSGFAWGLQSKTTHFREDIGWLDRMLFPHCGFDNGHQFALQRSVMAFGWLAQALNDLIGRILDREIDGHGSELVPK